MIDFANFTIILDKEIEDYIMPLLSEDSMGDESLKEIQKLIRKNVQLSFAWKELNPTQQVKFNGYGITEENFNSWTEEKQLLYVKCHG